MKGGDEEVRKEFSLGFKPIFTIACLAISIVLVLVFVMNFLSPYREVSKASSIVSVQLKEISPDVRARYSYTNGDYIFWLDVRNGDDQAQVRGFNISQEQEFVVSSQQAKPAHFVECNNNYVVWLDERENSPGIYGYNISNGKEFLIRERTLESQNLHQFQITDSYLFWIEDQNSNIMGYKFSTGNIFTVTDTQRQEWFPRSDDQFVGWEYLSDDNTFVRNICYKSIPDSETHNISFEPYLAFGTLTVCDNYLAFLADSGLSQNPNTAEIKIYNMVTGNEVKTVTLTYNGAPITVVQGIYLGKIEGSFKCLLLTFNILRYALYLIDPKLEVTDPGVIYPIEPILPPGEVVNSGATCPANALNHLFITHSPPYPKVGETSGNSYCSQNLSFYDLGSETLYPIITNNTAYGFCGKAVEKNSKIVVPVALRWTDIPTPSSTYLLKYVEVTLGS